jgi:GTP-binding protein HflX
LFAPHDPTLRKVRIPGVGPTILADTVGFIRPLPHRLVQALRATLDETVSATLLLHIIDCSAEERDENIDAVDAVLAEIGADEVPALHVFNKVDLTDFAPRVDRDESGTAIRVWVSATTGAGFDLLYQVLAERLAASWVDSWVRLPAGAGRLRARLHEAGEVVEERTENDGALLLRIRVNRIHFERLVREADLIAEDLFLDDAAVAALVDASYNREDSSSPS